MKTKKFTTLLAYLFLLQLGVLNAQNTNSLYFDGSDNYVEVAGDPLNDIGTGDFTFEMWIKGDVLEQPTHPMIFSNRGLNGSGGGVALFFHDLWGGSQYKMFCFQMDGNNWLFIDNGDFNGNILDNSCHHIALSRKEEVLSYYVDGELIGERTFTSISDISNDHPLWIGQDRATNNTFNGNISQFRIWDVARTETEIRDLMNYTIINEMPGLIANWEMTEGQGQVVADKMDNYNAQLGESGAVDNNDPSWSDEGCEVETPVSTNNLDPASIDFFPNPTSGMVTVTSTNEGSLFIEIIDMTGKVLSTSENFSSTTMLNMTDFVSGVYYVRMTSSGQSLTKKIVKL